jgi:small subunit ribosomal protein S1
MLTEYDEAGNYKYPEGFDSETNEWREGFDTQREKWELDYAAAQARWEQHKIQVKASNEAEIEAIATGANDASSFSSETASAGTLADDEALSALRAKLTNGNDEA